MKLLNATDERFYALVHQVLAANQKLLAREERRGSTRHRFPCLQWAAAYDAVSLPAENQFLHIECMDISPSGFSFYDEVDSPTWRNSSLLVVALGLRQPQFMVAEIVRSRTIETTAGPRTLFGCRFLARIVDRAYCPHLGGESLAAR